MIGITENKQRKKTWGHRLLIFSRDDPFFLTPLFFSPGRRLRRGTNGGNRQDFPNGKISWSNENLEAAFLQDDFSIHSKDIYFAFWFFTPQSMWSNFPLATASLQDVSDATPRAPPPPAHVDTTGMHCAHYAVHTMHTMHAVHAVFAVHL